MRALFDTNILISYLLKGDKDKAITKIIEAGFEKTYTLLLPQDVFDELKKKLIEKKYLAKYITKEEAEEFVKALATTVEEIPRIIEPIPRISRDKKDDYLLAYAFVGEADYLVTGDKDLQVLKKVDQVKIVSPQEFLKILNPF